MSFTSVTKSMTLGAALVASLGAAHSVRADLVYEEDIQNAPAQPPAPPSAPQAPNQVDDRAALRQALGSSEKARNSVQPAAPTLAPANPEVENFSRAELMRRERVRTEVQNEDALQERLEHLRLTDEQRRTKQILGSGDAGAAGTVGMPMPSQTAPIAAMPIQEQIIVAPATEHPGEAPVVPAKPGDRLASAGTLSAMDREGVNGVSTATAPELAREETSVSLSPRLGIANMIGNSSYQMSGHFATGVGLEIAGTDNLSFEVGYQYAEYGVSLASSNPFVQQIQYSPYLNGGGYNSETITMKQNVFEGGVKLYLLDRETKLRPFVGGGAAYAKSYINYDQEILQIVQQNPWLSQQFGSDYELSQFLGYLSAGLDFKLSKSVKVGAMGRYYTVFSSHENNSLNNMAFYPGYGSYFQSQNNYDKQSVAGSLARSGFYSVLGNVSFTF